MASVNEDLGPLQVALFVDAENLVTTATKAGYAFVPELITAKARAHGSLIYSRAYADWSVPTIWDCMAKLQLQGFQLEQLCTGIRGKNTADMQLAMDAMELCFSHNPPQVVILASGDRDFVPLVHKLRRRSIRVIGLGIEGSVSQALRPVCDEYVLYETLLADAGIAVLPEPRAEVPESDSPHPTQTQEGPPSASAEDGDEADSSSVYLDMGEPFRLLVYAVREALRQRGQALGSFVHQIMRQVDPGFSLERYRLPSLRSLADMAAQLEYVKVTIQSEGDMLLALGPKAHLLRPAVRDEDRPSSILTATDWNNVDAAAAAYSALLAQYKRVAILEFADRVQLVDDLFCKAHELADEGRYMTVRQMNDYVVRRSSAKGMSYPVVALQKLVQTLNIARCFDAGNGRGYVTDIDTEVGVACTKEEALWEMETTYIVGLRQIAPAIPLPEEAVAQWLFGSTDEHWKTRAHNLVTSASSGNRH